MHFHAHIALALTLMALASGIWVLGLAQAPTATDKCKTKSVVFGWFIIGLSLLSLVCVLYGTISGCCGKGESHAKRGCHYSAPSELSGTEHPAQ